jgi:hypothetical protein
MQQRDDVTAPQAHLTAGELHTFLDGHVAVFGPVRAQEIRAHLAECGPCRDRLAVESSVQDRASAILGSEAGPSTLELPSLAEMQAVAGQGAGEVPEPGRGRLERRVRWGWAATVVLSLGVGYGVGAWGPGVGVPVSEEAIPSARAGESLQDAAPQTPGPVAEAPVSRPIPDREESEAAAPMATATAKARQEADQAESPPEALPRRTVEEPVPAAARVAPVRERETFTVPSPNVVGAGAERAPDSLSVADSLAGRSASALDRLSAVESVAQPPVRGDVAERLAAGSAARMSIDETGRPARMLRSVVGDPTLGSPAPPREDASDRVEADVDVSLVLDGLTIESLRWMEVWPGQQGLVSIQRFADGRRVELRIAGPAVGDRRPVTPPPGTRTDPVEGWARVMGPLGSGWVALDGPLSAEELGELLATIR